MADDMAQPLEDALGRDFRGSPLLPEIPLMRLETVVELLEKYISEHWGK
jgi:hypothetical protein